ncbi:MAG: hypothetical protein ACI4IJ_11345 [Acutalibacteraceae bacterium]
MKKSKLMLIASSAAFAASVYLLAAAVLYQPNQGIAAPANISSSDMSSCLLVSSEEAFTPKVIKIHDGKITVFEQGGGEPILILDKVTDELPDETVNQLQSGINVHTHDEYLSYLEDFS